MFDYLSSSPHSVLSSATGDHDPGGLRSCACCVGFLDYSSLVTGSRGVCMCVTFERVVSDENALVLSAGNTDTPPPPASCTRTDR